MMDDQNASARTLNRKNLNPSIKTLLKRLLIRKTMLIVGPGGAMGPAADPEQQ